MNSRFYPPGRSPLSDATDTYQNYRECSWLELTVYMVSRPEIVFAIGLGLGACLALLAVLFFAVGGL